MTENQISLLRNKLENVENSYENFIRSMIDTCYEHNGFYDTLTEFIKNNPNATADDISEIQMEYIGIPFFDEKDGQWHRWDKIITEEEAARIAQNEFCDN